MARTRHEAADAAATRRPGAGTHARQQPKARTKAQPGPKPGPSARPGPLLGLRNLRVRSRLIAVLVIPAVAFLVVASIAIGSTLGQARAFDSGRRLAELGRQVTALAHEVQSERDLSAGYIQSGRQLHAAELAEQRGRVDDQAAAYRLAEARLYDDLGQRVTATFDTVRGRLAGLTPLRAGIDAAVLTARGAFDEYSGLVAALLDVDREIALVTSDEPLTQSARALDDLGAAKEATAQVRGTLYAILVRRAFASGEFQDLADLLAQQRAAFNQFQADANQRQRTEFTSGLTGQAVLAAQRIEDAALNRQASQNLGLDPEQWYAATSTQIELIRGDEERLLDEVIDQSRALSAAAERRLVLEIVTIALILAVALLALAVVTRSMARPLQRLRVAAMDIADHRLPAAVEQLRSSGRNRLDIAVEPVGISSKDEIGQVAQAVDAIQLVAVRLATEQSALRRSIGDMFTNLARRSQTLIDRQLELIDDLERSETDPATLKHLFTLDHLATRMRRNAEDLIVLSGADPGQHWAQPMTLIDVVRAATAEVEEYQRVELLALPDVEVAGHATVDVIHLLAELIENATSFSPPSAQVQIAGQAVGHGYIIEVEDRGLGMTDDELAEANDRLEDPPEIDFSLSQMLGLYVVGRLAQRHGIRVQLRRSWYGGVTALTMLPYQLLVWPGEPPAVTGRAGAPQARPVLPRHERLKLATETYGEPPPSLEPARPEPEWFTPTPDEAATTGQHERFDPVAPAQVPEQAPTVAPMEAQQPAAAEQQPPEPIPEMAQRLTNSGLPRRVPKSNLSPSIVATGQGDDLSGPIPGANFVREGGPPRPPSRTPEDLRDVLAGYHSGLEHGRLAADRMEAAQPTDDPE